MKQRIKHRSVAVVVENHRRAMAIDPLTDSGAH